MNSIKVCYTNRDNMGDSINPFIIRDVFGMLPINSNQYTCEITGIGSGLRRFFIDTAESTFRRKLMAHFLRSLSNMPVILWSAGFLSTPSGREISIRKNMKVASVRGELSKGWVEHFLKRKLDCTVGDAGLLVSELIPRPEKRYVLGIIPHDRERGEGAFQHIHETVSESVIIDVRGDPIERLELIAQCECIISSSLHGLVFADSFHIPNRQIKLTNRLSGDGFKFADYYSAFGLHPNPLDIRREQVDLSEIVKNYRIPANQVAEMKKEIQSAFQRYL